jgi:hypothetical protein
MAESLDDTQASPVAARRGHRQAARRHDQCPAVVRVVRAMNNPVSLARREPGDGCSKSEDHAQSASVLDERVADIACAIAGWKQLAGVFFEGERHGKVALKELALLRKWPRPQQAAQQARSGIGHEPFRRESRRQDVAAATAANQNLPAAVGCAFEQQHSGAAAGSKDRCHEAGRAGPDDHDVRAFQAPGPPSTLPRVRD